MQGLGGGRADRGEGKVGMAGLWRTGSQKEVEQDPTLRLLRILYMLTWGVSLTEYSAIYF